MPGAWRRWRRWKRGFETPFKSWETEEKEKGKSFGIHLISVIPLMARLKILTVLIASGFY